MIDKDLETLIAKYTELTERLNVVAKTHNGERSYAGGVKVPIEALELISERIAVSVAIAERLTGMRFVGW